MIERRRPRCSPRHARNCSHAHAALVAEYRDARDAQLALRESGVTAPASVTFGSSATYSQLEDDDFAAVVPPVRFKDWLLGHARQAVEA